MGHERSFGLQAEVFFRAFGSDGGLEATATPDPMIRLAAGTLLTFPPHPSSAGYDI